MPEQQPSSQAGPILGGIAAIIVAITGFYVAVHRSDPKSAEPAPVQPGPEAPTGSVEPPNRKDNPPSQSTPRPGVPVQPSSGEVTHPGVESPERVDTGAPFPEGAWVWIRAAHSDDYRTVSSQIRGFRLYKGGDGVLNLKDCVVAMPATKLSGSSQEASFQDAKWDGKTLNFDVLSPDTKLKEHYKLHLKDGMLSGTITVASSGYLRFSPEFQSGVSRACDG